MKCGGRIGMGEFLGRRGKKGGRMEGRKEARMDDWLAFAYTYDMRLVLYVA